MAKRKRKNTFYWLTFVAFAVIGAAAVYFWPQIQTQYRQWSGQVPKQKAPVLLPVELNVCGLFDREFLHKHFGPTSAVPKSIRPDMSRPLAGGCELSFANATLTVLVSSTNSRKRGGAVVDAQRYFNDAVIGMEYALKATPSSLLGLGDAARHAGFDQGDGQLIVKRGEKIFEIAGQGISLEQAKVIAKQTLSHTSP